MLQTLFSALEFSQERLGYLTGNPSLLVMYALELAAFISGLVFWRKFSGTPVIWFILFLGYNFLNEITASTIYIFGLAEHTSIFYNIRYPFYFGVYFYMYYKYSRSKRFKSAIAILFGVWLLSYLYFVLTNGVIERVALFSRVLGGFFLLLVILFYLIETINHNVSGNFRDDFLVFVSLALVLNLVVQLPVLTMTYVGWPKAMELDDTRREFFNIIRNASFWVSCVMYLIFIYGFYRSKSPKKIMPY